MGKITLYTTVVKVLDTDACVSLLQDSWIVAWKEDYSDSGNVVRYSLVGTVGHERGLEVSVDAVRLAQELRIFSREEGAVETLCSCLAEHITSEVVVSDSSVQYIKPVE